MKESRVVLVAGEANGKLCGNWAPEMKWDKGKSMEHSWPRWRYRAGSREHCSGDMVREWAARESAKNRSAGKRSGAEKQSQLQFCSLFNGGLLGFCYFSVCLESFFSISCQKTYLLPVRGLCFSFETVTDSQQCIFIKHLGRGRESERKKPSHSMSRLCGSGWRWEDKNLKTKIKKIQSESSEKHSKEKDKERRERGESEKVGQNCICVTEYPATNEASLGEVS